MPPFGPVSRRGFIASASALAAAGVVPGSSAEAGAAQASAPAAGGSTSRQSGAALTRKLTVPTPASPKWPVLTRYDEAHLRRIAMPIGGIGTGTISLGGRGNLQDFELVNRPAKGYTPPNTFFALYCKPQDGPAVTRCLEGLYDLGNYEGESGAIGRNHGLPRFRQCNFAAAYPFGQVMLADKDVPLQVRIEAFNPMTPVDADVSGIPTAILRFVLINPTNKPIAATVCGTVENHIGWLGNTGKVDRNQNEFRENGGVKGIFMRSEGVTKDMEGSGTLGFATTAQNVTHRTDWVEASWGNALLDFWDDLSTDGKLDTRESNRPAPFGSLAASVDVPANGETTVTFLITWHFPNRLAWNAPRERVGNYYTKQYSDAWDVVTKTAPRLEELEKKTLEFVNAFVNSDVPPLVKEAALYNASTLRTQTAFRTEDGRFFGWEGCNDYAGCCHGSCTHVWNYEQATAFLYGDLAKSMRDAEFAHATEKSGRMSFRIELPLASKATEWDFAAADGQMGTIMKLYRDWRLSGDNAMLKTLWPGAKRALEFAWRPGSWDGDRDGVMEGCQHNTMDIEYFGPNPEVGTWYLGALRASALMATAVGEPDFAKTCDDMATRGAKWMDANLFNGEYYEHQIIPIPDTSKIAPGLRRGKDTDDLTNPELQLGAGCLTDQLVGQYMAHVCGLGHILDAKNVRTTLASILKHNYREDLSGHFNHLRTYALGEEAGTIIATYPKGNRPARPFPYAFEVWTGLEYTAAAGMLYEGMDSEAMQIVAAVRDRHDGHKRNPFNEPECGHHYARAMAAWALVLAATGFDYDGLKQTIRFKASKQPAKWFWSNGYAWGTLEQGQGGAGRVKLNVLGGALRVQTLEVAGVGKHTLDAARTLKAGESLEATLSSVA